MSDENDAPDGNDDEEEDVDDDEMEEPWEQFKELWSRTGPVGRLLFFVILLIPILAVLWLFNQVGEALR